VVPGSLHRRAEETIGAEGIVDVTVLMGWFTGVSLTLAAFDVPSNAVGLKQQPVGFGQFTQSRLHSNDPLRRSVARYT